MASKEFKALKELNLDELKAALRETEVKWFEAKIQHQARMLNNTASLKNAQKKVARLKMLLAERVGARA